MNTSTYPVLSDSRPVFVMGLPRSGSTLLSRLLNETDDILSVNDLYYLQAVLAEDAEQGTLSRPQLTRLLDNLLEVISTRATAEEEFIGQFSVSAEQIDEIRQSVLLRAENGPLTWADLMNQVLTAVAKCAGKTRWADKTPQNFYHFELLEKCFPNASFVFLFRDPRNILSSFKFASGEGHDARRYHPVAYALYWRSAIRYYLRLKEKANVAMVRYEDIVGATQDTCARLSSFLCTTIRTTDISSIGHNSSFRKGPRKGVTGLEMRICERLCAAEMAELGYSTKYEPARPTDVLDLTRTSAVFAAFQLRRFVADKDARGRIVTFFKGLNSPSGRT